MAYSGAFQDFYHPLVVRQKRSDAVLKTYASVEDARAYSMDPRERAMVLEDVVKGKSGASTCDANPNSKGVSDGSPNVVSDGSSNVVSVDDLQKELKVLSLRSQHAWASLNLNFSG